MKLRKPHVWIATFSAAAVIGVALVDVGRASPGALALVHQREIDLEDRGSCQQCHGGWTTGMSESCIECHATVAEQIEAGLGLHGTLGREQAGRCAQCHSEHHGGGFAVVNRRSFALAGVADRDQFDHAKIGFEMGGQHLEQACSDCHEHADDEVLPKGSARFFGLDQNCATCHEDPHEGELAALLCGQCHGQEAFDQLSSFGHEGFLPLVGAHAEVSCSVCHADDEGYSLDEMGAGRKRPASRACMDCHASPHDRDFVKSVARMAATTPAGSCVACHVPDHLSFRSEDLTLSTAQHAASGFALQAPHVELSCEQCHAVEFTDFAARYPGRGADECAACHKDPHAGQFSDGPFAGQGCAVCHETDHFEPHAFTTEKHALSSMALTGAHLSIDCADCHTVAEDGVRAFHGTPAACEDCHEDAHTGFFDERVATRGTAEAGSCALCHQTTVFGEVPSDVFDHEDWTGFAVQGAHAQEACGICHASAAEPDPLGRSFGRVEEQFGEYSGCETCHVDPHGGQFDGSTRTAVVNDQVGCMRCHVETSFRAFPDGFDHLRWTGMALRGAHGDIDCSRCHVPLPGGEEGSRTWSSAGDKQCSTCHTNPHAGQFRKDGQTDCRGCHTSAESFSELAFYHDRDSRFRLGRAHRDLACAECHEAWDVGDGTEIVRYRPLPTDCVACHGAYEDELLKQWRQK